MQRIRTRNFILHLLVTLIAVSTVFIVSCKKESEDCAQKIAFYEDEDGDGFGNSSARILRCDKPEGYVTDSTDCNDNNAGIYPGAKEIDDDGIDQDCDGFDGQIWYLDKDADGYGNPLVKKSSNSQPAGYVKAGTDCNDSNMNINPGAPDIPNNGIDENCDGKDAGLWFEDADKDGFGNVEKRFIGNAAPLSFVADSSDCNDTNNSIHPGAKEIPENGIDENCNGVDAIKLYRDKDGDYFGDKKIWIYAEELVDGYVINDYDCDDNNADISPLGDELCDGKDNNCDNQIDEDFNLQKDVNNCGSCGNVCPPGFTCQAGICVKL